MDSDYLFILTKILCPLANEFRPDIVLVSAGFDACIGDPLVFLKFKRNLNF